MYMKGNMTTSWCSVLFIICLVDVVKLLQNGLARKPPMGWMSWGYYECSVDCFKDSNKCLDERLIKSVADSFYTEGYQEAGFEYIIIDDCWAEKTRDSEGRLVPDRKRFPNGMKYLADYFEEFGCRYVQTNKVTNLALRSIDASVASLKQIHMKGLKFGMYTNIAASTCMNYPGSRGYFEIDAKTFAEWEVDYLKVDGCFVGEDYLNIAYIDLGKHLNATSRPMVYSCSWPYYIQYIIKKTPNYEPVATHCNMWRNYHDVVQSWGAVKAIVQHYQQEFHRISGYHGPGQWNDPDMLVFGNNALSAGQSRVHLAVYVMLSAPLLLSCDMKSITEYEKQLLLNMDLLAIGQDPMGIMAEPFRLPNTKITLWVKPHLPKKGDKYHSVSFALVNLRENDEVVSFTPGKYGLNSTDAYTIMDVFTKTFIRNITLKDVVEVTVPAEDVIMYSVFPL